VRPQSYVFNVALDKRGRTTGVHYFDADEARAVSEGARGGAVGQRRRDLAAAAQFRQQPLPARPGEFQRHGRQVPDVQSGLRRARVFEHELNEYKSVQVTRILHDFYEADPKRGFYGGGGIDAHGPQPAGWALVGRRRPAALGSGSEGAPRGFPRSMMSYGTLHLAGRGDQQRQHRPDAQGRMGHPGDSRDLQGSCGRSGDGRFLQDRSYEIMQAAGAQKVWRDSAAPLARGGVHLLGTCRMGNDPAELGGRQVSPHHDVPNLFICDGSSFVTSGRGQPTMTIQALAFRAADHIGAICQWRAIQTQRNLEPVRSAAHQGLSHAALAGEILRRAVRARRAQARAASLSRADGHCLRAVRGRPGCAHCGFCGGFGCEVMAKSSSLYTMIPEAEATGRCEVRAQSYVFNVAVNAAGRATGVHYFDRDKHEQFQKARAVVVSANGGETARLLLNSASSRFPQGLANSSGMVGKYLMFNQGGGVHAVFEHELNEYKSVQVTRILHDFYLADPKRGFYGGGGIDARMADSPPAGRWPRARIYRTGERRSRSGSRPFRAR
jgi:choline dehydrogenase-like flavoprotein